jgi:hypothetical protein
MLKYGGFSCSNYEISSATPLFHGHELTKNPYETQLTTPEANFLGLFSTTRYVPME